MNQALKILDKFQSDLVQRWHKNGYLSREACDAMAQAEKLRGDIIHNREMALLDWVDADYPELAEAAGAALCL